eukprot:1363335-Prymnesium_polylepis.2
MPCEGARARALFATLDTDDGRIHHHAVCTASKYEREPARVRGRLEGLAPADASAEVQLVETWAAGRLKEQAASLAHSIVDSLPRAPADDAR